MVPVRRRLYLAGWALILAGLAVMLYLLATDTPQALPYRAHHGTVPYHVETF